MKQVAGITDGASTEMDSQNKLAFRSDRSPHPDPLSVLLDPGDQLIKLKMTNLNSAKEQPLMQQDAVLASAFQPAADGGMVVIEDARSG